MIRGFNSSAVNLRLLTVTMCFLAALIEGIDLQSMGIAASGIASEFQLGRSVLGAVLTASPYPTLVRGTGTGAAVAVGRLGAIIGPFFAGQLLNLGASRGKVVESSS